MDIVEKIRMNVLKKRVETMSVEDVCWNLFKLTGQINYYLLFSALTDMQKDNKWKNFESPEL